MDALSITEQRLAMRLAELRQEKGYSLEALSEETGISRASLSRIERGETSPTAALMNRLCRAYGLTMSRLLSEVESPGPQLLRRDAQPIWQDRESGYLRRSVSPPAADFHSEVIAARLKGGAQIVYDAPPVAGIEQHLWMLEGMLIFTLNDTEWRLEAGDCLRFHLVGRSAFHAPEPEGAYYALVVNRT